MIEAKIVQITAQCLCKDHTFTASIPSTLLPLRASCCHCDSCRHNTGALYSSDTPWPGSSAEARESSLTRYKFSERINVLFCGRCSSPMFFEEKNGGAEEPPTYGVFTGVLKGEYPEGGLLVRIVEHIFVGDTLDGGASCWLRRPHGDDAPPAKMWLGKRGSSEEVDYPNLWPSVADLPAPDAKLAQDEIPIRCVCGGVDLVLKAGEAQRDHANAQEVDRGPPVVDPTSHKSLGTFDGCNSCRLSSGVDMFHWSFYLLKYISFPSQDEDGKTDFPNHSAELRAAVDLEEERGRDPRLGTLTYYSSSPDVQRYFCGRCSACVFYAVDQRPYLVDLSIGILWSPDGARAEGAISWSLGGKASHRQDMIGGWREGLVQAIENSAEEWRIERGYPINWRRTAREQAEREAAEKGETK
ncbi:Mss4-like protein [Lasiosphaeris hirsuta]|uniref:Mss4-like protein n=1 Tax=Lasiosphaeris hirsuta TaxID=260670 RepID=A0AA40AQS9_9PEZI|nr:Mss4-like protein [Lasiosphaeris hirsuta]